MRRVAAVAAALTGLLAVSLLRLQAATADDQQVVCDPRLKLCSVVVEDTEETGEGREAAGSRHKGKGPVIDPRRRCFTQLASPQPPASDPAWAGHDPGTGKIYVRTCPFTHAPGLAAPVFVPDGQQPPVVVTPGQLALQALRSLQLPDPVIRRSPSERNRDDGPYTWVNLWTWYWTSPTTWRALSKSASAGAVSAEVTVTPEVLVFDPGNGAAPVSCPGPGRPWRPADGNSAPSAGGCGYRYRSVSSGGPVTARLSIRWSVEWTGSGGAGGTLPAMTTSATSSFTVQQLQAVVVDR
jgi:hypothetical protein